MNSNENDCWPAASKSLITGAGPTGMVRRLSATPTMRRRQYSPAGLVCGYMATDAASPGQAGLDRIRREVAAALESFLGRQRGVLAAIGDDMLPCLEAMRGLLAGGKRLRPAFCYWGWRAAGGEDCPEIYTAAASLELLQASALIHDDVMDASDTRRGRPAVHKQFAARHRAAGHAGSADQFGAGAAILIGDALLSWTDQLYHDSSLPADTLRR